MENKNLVFSINNENYYDDVQYILECFKENLELKEIYVAEKIEIFHKDVLNESNIISLQETLEDNAIDLSEYGDNYLNDLNEIKRKELQEVILNWMNNNLTQPQWFNVKNIKKITKLEFVKLYV